MVEQRIIEIDGRTGEGGGQILRIAIGLAALTTQAVRITNIRGNRPRGGGLKNQHFTSIQVLAEATDAEVEGLRVGSQSLTFIPRRAASDLARRNFNITAASGAASTLLIFQAILPFFLFAGNSDDEPIWLTISGGTNTSFSPTFEYLDQVLLPTLEDRFSIQVERELRRRAWSLGPQGRGEIQLKIQPLSPGRKLQSKSPPVKAHSIRSIDVSIIAPVTSHTVLQELLASDLGDLLPSADVNYKLMEDSRTDGRWYILLVAKSAAGLRWGHDVMCGMPKKTKSRDVFVQLLVKNLCKGLHKELSVVGQVDEHLQDQVVCFQALAEGFSSFPRDERRPRDQRQGDNDNLVTGIEHLESTDREAQREAVDGPFGTGSLHTRTARWVAHQLLPEVEFYANGDTVKGVGFSSRLG